MKIIPIFFTFDRNYILAAKVAIHSMLVHASKNYIYKLYVLHTTLSTKDCSNISSVVNDFNAEIHFVDVSEYEKKIKGLEGKSHFSKEIFYKLIAADIFPEYDRILCTDVDVIFIGDISEAFFLFPNENFIYAGVGPTDNSGRMPQYQKNFSKDERDILEHEIGAGFLLLNIEAIRRHNKQKEMTDFYINNYERLILPEQDCMILTCWPYVRYMPIRFVVLSAFYKLNVQNIRFYKGTPDFDCSHNEAVKHFLSALNNPLQLHYAGPDKPWNSIMVTKQKEWLKAMVKAQCLWEYIYSQPRFFMQKIKRYSLRRFIYKHFNIK